MTGSGWLNKLRRDQRGNVLMIGAASLPVIIGAAAMAVDTINMALSRRQMQRAADSAALAGAHARVQSANINAAVTSDLGLNSRVTLTGSPVIENAPTTGPFAGNQRAVRVQLTARPATPFMSFFTGTTPSIRVEATAAWMFTGQFCMVSLEDGEATGITFTGSTTVNLGCGVASNSRSANGVVASGNATVTASPIAAVGGVPASSGYVQPTVLLPYSPSQTDPYANLPTPNPTDCQGPVGVQPNRSDTISPGCYRGMDIKGTLNLRPGIYFIDGSSVSFGSQAEIRGTGVTIVLTSTTAATNPNSIASLSIHGGAMVSLTPPETGPYAGVIMYQDRRATAGNTVQINGNSSSLYEGGFYFPRADLTFNGTTGMNTECLQLVARRLTFSGNSRVQNTCPANGGARAFDANFVRLVA